MQILEPTLTGGEEPTSPPAADRIEAQAATPARPRTLEAWILYTAIVAAAAAAVVLASPR